MCCNLGKSFLDFVLELHQLTSLKLSIKRLKTIIHIYITIVR